jgi:hypothetical protein
MPSHDGYVSPIENEKELLRLLCANGVSIVDRQTLRRQLTCYCWRDRDHGVLFETIGELLSAAPREILAHLPAALTRRGFPDMSCDWLAAPSELNANEAFALAENMLRASQ